MANRDINQRVKRLADLSDDDVALLATADVRTENDLMYTPYDDTNVGLERIKRRKLDYIGKFLALQNGEMSNSVTMDTIRRTVLFPNFVPQRQAAPPVEQVAPPPQRLNTEPMFWSSEEQPNNDALRSSCLVTTNGASFPQTGTNKLFIRRCYTELLQSCHDQWNNGTQGIYVIGTPGVGKSCFLDYVLHCCLYNDRENVLYLDGPRRKARHFRHDHDNGTISVTEYELKEFLMFGIPSDEIDVVLYDPHEVAARTDDVHIDELKEKRFLVATQPKRDYCKKLKKDSDSMFIFYMGPLSSVEAECMRSSCFHTRVSKNLLEKRYQIIGGITRFLFRSLQNGVDRAIESVRMKQTAAIELLLTKPKIIDQGEVAAEYKGLWTLFYLQPVDNYEGFIIEMVCDDIRIRIRDTLMKKEVTELWELYINTDGSQGPLKGIRYEAYAHKKIEADGVDLNATSLTTEGLGKKKIKIPRKKFRKIFLEDNDRGDKFKEKIIKARDGGAYVLPSTCNFPVVDSFYVPNGKKSTIVSLQMKAGRSKPLSATPANEIYEIVKGNLVFVVPNATTITKQLQYTDASGPKE